MNREQWLNALTDDLRLLFDDVARPLPASVYVSVGWPSKGATSSKKRVIGQCWSGLQSKDGAPHVFISPVLEDPHDVAATLVHELLHAAIGVEHGHKAPFKTGMKLVGLDGKATATHAGPELTLRLKDLVAKLPAFPHMPLAVNAPGLKPQTTRMLKCVCEDHPEFLVRASRKVLDLGLPRCGQCGEVMQEAA